MTKDNTGAKHYKVVLSVFELKNDYGCYCPRRAWQMKDEKSESWFVNCGGSRCYITGICNIDTDNLEIGSNDAIKSHFVANRTIAALMMSHSGLFTAVARGRTAFSIGEPLIWQSQLNLEYENDAIGRIHNQASEEDFASWLSALIEHTPLRRAIDDLILSLRNPSEAFVWLHRGFEWLEDGIGISKKEMAESIGVSLRELKDLGRIANSEGGVRQASKDGRKMIADLETYASWSAALLDAINVGRKRLDGSFVRMESQKVASIIRSALDTNPFP